MIDAARGTDLFSLKGKVVVVTGASSGIGLAIAHGAAAAGARVGLNGRNPETLAARCAEIPGSFPLPFDVADLAAGTDALHAAIETHGRLDGLVCNAGARDRRGLAEVETENFRDLIETNLIAPFDLARHAGLHMAERGEGRIVFLTSLAGDFARPGDVLYPGTKAGLSGLLRALAVELGPFGVNVNGIAPGPIATEMNKPLTADPDFTAMIERNIPLGRWASPDELSGTAIFLLSDASSYVNGHVVAVDGGARVRMFS